MTRTIMVATKLDRKIFRCSITIGTNFFISCKFFHIHSVNSKSGKSFLAALLALDLLEYACDPSLIFPLEARRWKYQPFFPSKTLIFAGLFLKIFNSPIFLLSRREMDSNPQRILLPSTVFKTATRTNVSLSDRQYTICSNQRTNL